MNFNHELRPNNYNEDDESHNLLTKEDDFSEQYQSFEHDTDDSSHHKNQKTRYNFFNLRQNRQRDDEFEPEIKSSRVALKGLLIITTAIIFLYSKKNNSPVRNFK